ncbi:hypothetical protein [Microbacterium sp. H83]|uniref:hypothetical protein n=1 Tax=Microbacterium sp. H83 TaxID=1827324 RepID=UPI0007F5127C|nr:hypothetical protein [Microbacterium sp. H83]OAN35160.1 hypothetical protein A4X16_04705 [Microbacterium sp. H83]
MLNADETSELRDLQQRAYGRDGVLTSADAARLHELEAARAAAGRSPQIAPHEQEAADGRAAAGESADARVAGADAGDAVAVPAARADADGGTLDGAALEGQRERDGGAPSATAAAGLWAAVRGRVPLVAAASVVLLLIGIAAGWALFGRAEERVALTGAQQERRVELQTDGGYDEGSVRAIGSDDDAVVWYGTKKDGELACIVLDAGGESSDMCQPADQLLSQGDGVGVTLIDPGGDAEDGAPGGEEMQISATAVRAATGDIVALIQRWPSSRAGWLAQFAVGERERAEELLELGFEQYSFSVVGYVNDSAIWRGTRIDDGMPEECMIVDALDLMQCEDAVLVQNGDRALSIGGVEVDEGSGEAGTPWSIDLEVMAAGNAYLTIRGEVPDSLDSTTGAFVELGGEHGDPIRVEAPSDPAG